MPSAFGDNVAGHRSKYEVLKAILPAGDVGRGFVVGDPLWIGYKELEVIRRFKDLDGATVVDIGCGIGRLTQHLAHEKVARYLGIDIIPEILQDAVAIGHGDDRFQFAIGVNCTIPMENAAADVVVAYSVITHLLGEEVFEYLLSAERVLKPGGMAIFSFMDFTYPPTCGDLHRSRITAPAGARRSVEVYYQGSSISVCRQTRVLRGQVHQHCRADCNERSHIGCRP